MAAASPPAPRLLLALLLLPALLLLLPPGPPCAAAAGPQLGRRFAERKRCADLECSSEWGPGQGLGGEDASPWLFPKPSPSAGSGAEIGGNRGNGNAAPTRAVPSLSSAKFSDPRSSVFGVFFSPAKPSSDKLALWVFSGIISGPIRWDTDVIFVI